MIKKRRANVVDPEIAKKAAGIFIPSMEERYTARALGADRVDAIRRWAVSEDLGRRRDFIEAVCRLVDIGLKAKK